MPGTPHQEIDNLLRHGWRIESQTERVTVLTRGRPVNHILHLLLSVFTLGVWLIVWLMLGIFGGIRRKTIVHDASQLRRPEEADLWQAEPQSSTPAMPPVVQSEQQALRLWNGFEVPVWIVAVAGVILVLIAIGAVSSAVDDDGNNRAVNTSRQPTSTPGSGSAAFIPPTSAPIPTATIDPAVNRADCDLIRGTQYLSEKERTWYLANCIEPSPQPTLVSERTSAVAPTRRPTTGDEKLALLSSSCTYSYGFRECEGFVKNLSAETMESIMVVVTWLDTNGTPQSTDEALIDFDPLLAGQESPWNTIGTYNPALTRVRIQFKELFGGTISTRDDRQ